MPGGSWKVIIPPFCVKEKTLSYRLGCWPLTITEIKVFLWSFSGEKPEQIRGETWVFTIDVLGSLGGERVMWPRKHHSFLFNQASSLRTHYYLQPRPGKTTRSTGTIRLMGGGGGYSVNPHPLLLRATHLHKICISASQFNANRKVRVRRRPEPGLSPRDQWSSSVWNRASDV